MAEKTWSKVVAPPGGLFDLDFAEVWRYRDLLFLLMRRDVVVNVKQTVLGPLWLVLQPLISTFVFTIVFGRIAKMTTDGTPAFAFYLCGVILWNYFTNCMLSCSSVMQANAHILTRVYYPRLSQPIATVLAHSLRSLIQVGILFMVLTYVWLTDPSVRPTPAILLFPFVFLLTGIFGGSIGLIFSSLSVRVRDLGNLATLICQLWMYATPVVYPLSRVPDAYLLLYDINPMTVLLEVFRLGFLDRGEIHFQGVIFCGLIIGLTVIVSLFLFSKAEKVFVDTL